MNKIYMSELFIALGYRDERAVKEWCMRNNVLLQRDGKAKFVFESAFKEVSERPFIEKLKREFGNDWESAYNVYASGNIAALTTLQRIPDVRYKTYMPKNSIKNKYKNQFNEYAKSKKAA
jgi:hypothetical protein